MGEPMIVEPADHVGGGGDDGMIFTNMSRMMAMQSSNVVPDVEMEDVSVRTANSWRAWGGMW